jgi:DNA-3-methyladenine glycosylase II
MIGKIFSPFVRKGLLGEKPFPKNSPTDPAFVVSSEKDLEAERRRLMDLVNRFCELGRENAGRQTHSFFGRMSGDEWGITMYKHLDHHLRSSARRRLSDGNSHFHLRSPGPYSLAATASRFRRWPEIVDRFDRTTYRRLLPIGRRGVLLGFASPAGRRASRAVLPARRARSPQARRGGAPRPRHRARRRARRSPVLPVVPRRSAPRRRAAPLARAEDRRNAVALGRAIVTAVLSQQINLPFAYDIRRELSIAFGRRARFDGETWFDFPKPARIARETERSLRKFRLSRAKAGTLLRTAKAFASGELSEQQVAALDDEAAIARLTSIPGIGRWTAEIALLRGLGRADVFPGGDLGVVKYVAMQLLGHRARVTEARMRRFADRWRPYRGLALVYAYAEINRRSETRRTVVVSRPENRRRKT